MCLDYLLQVDINKSFYHGDKNLIPKTGYKIVEMPDGDCWQPVFRGSWEYYNLDEWYVDDTDGEIETHCNSTYPTGFHVFTNYKQACEFREEHAPAWGDYNGPQIVEVEVDDVHTIGIQDGCTVIVCKKIKVLRPKTTWQKVKIWVKQLLSIVRKPNTTSTSDDHQNGEIPLSSKETATGTK